MQQIFSIDAMEQRARRALPRTVFDFIQGGAEDEHTIGRNRAAFARIEFIPRILRDVTEVDIRRTFLGERAAMPLMLAPTAMSRIFHHGGELAAARAAASCAVPYCLSAVASTSIEAVANAATVRFFQMYMWRRREWVNELLKYCQRFAVKGLVLAVDSPTLGKRERDLRHGYGQPLRFKAKILVGGLGRPRWLVNQVFRKKLQLPNCAGLIDPGQHSTDLIAHIHDQFDASVTWDDAQRLRDRWQGPFILKGIQSVEDAVSAVSIGATAIILSNHGGRQLDGAPVALELLPEIRTAVGDRLEILIDGGIRRGSDLVKAVALGADACLIGRAYLYGLAAGGEAGVERILQILKDEMCRTLRLLGCANLAELDSSYITTAAASTARLQPRDCSFE